MTLNQVHHTATEGYSTAPEQYVSGRPGYSAEAASWLRDVVGVEAGSVVVDLGAGTGKFLPYLIDTGARVIAVEPVEAMRTTLARKYPQVEAMAGSADAMPLAYGTVDAVVCAQAFHWFATKSALSEIVRVLKPGGRLGLIWNRRDISVDWVRRLSDLTDRHQGDVPRYQDGGWREAFPFEGLALVDEQHFQHSHVGPPEQVIVGRTLSVSFVAAMTKAEQDRIADQVRGLIAATPELAGRDEVVFPYVTDAYVYERRG